MKRSIALLIALTLLLSCASALAENLYGKDIQFSGHTFGETFAQAIQGIKVNSVEFEEGRWPVTSRRIADPAYMDIVYLMNRDESAVRYCFSMRAGEQTVAGYRANVTMHFYYPDADAASRFELGRAQLNAGVYDFYEGDAKGIYDSLKGKLTSLYGDPLAVTEDANEVWGEIAYREDMERADGEREYQEAVDRCKATLVAWKSSTNGGMVVLMNYFKYDTPMTSLCYVDSRADEVIQSLYESSSGSSAADDSMEGL